MIIEMILQACGRRVDLSMRNNSRLASAIVQGVKEGGISTYWLAGNQQRYVTLGPTPHKNI